MVVEINIIENGPILIKGETVVTKDGKKIEVKENYALCRCGKSGKQPMCDGTHKTCSFE